VAHGIDRTVATRRLKMALGILILRPAVALVAAAHGIQMLLG
jgi:hypothetical protein